MIEIYPRDRGDLCVRGRRRIETSAETRFEDRKFDTGFGECKKCDRSHLFEKSRNGLELAVFNQLLGRSSDERRKLGKIIFADIGTVDVYPLRDRDEMRRRVH